MSLRISLVVEPWQGSSRRTRSHDEFATDLGKQPGVEVAIHEVAATEAPEDGFIVLDACEPRRVLESMTEARRARVVLFCDHSRTELGEPRRYQVEFGLAATFVSLSLAHFPRLYGWASVAARIGARGSRTRLSTDPSAFAMYSTPALECTSGLLAKYLSAYETDVLGGAEAPFTVSVRVEVADDPGRWVRLALRASRSLGGPGPLRIDHASPFEIEALDGPAPTVNGAFSRGTCEAILLSGFFYAMRRVEPWPAHTKVEVHALEGRLQIMDGSALATASAHALLELFGVDRAKLAPETRFRVVEVTMTGERPTRSLDLRFVVEPREGLPLQPWVEDSFAGNLVEEDPEVTPHVTSAPLATALAWLPAKGFLVWSPRSAPREALERCSPEQRARVVLVWDPEVPGREGPWDLQADLGLAATVESLHPWHRFLLYGHETVAPWIDAIVWPQQPSRSAEARSMGPRNHVGPGSFLSEYLREYERLVLARLAGGK